MSSLKKESFFKVFLPQHSAHRMKIPSNYQKYMEGKNSGAAFLRGPSGNNWQVSLVKDNENLYLARGWPVFVKDNGIKLGYFLSFKFDGDKTFKVRIFNPTCCEDKTALRANPSQGDGNSPYVAVKEEEDSWEREENALVQGRSPSAANDHEFTVKLSVYSVEDTGRGKTIVIPRWFAKIHFAERTPVVLQWEDKEWQATVTISRRICYLRGGWQDFVRESKVRAGEFCKFELVGRNTLCVHVEE